MLADRSRRPLSCRHQLVAGRCSRGVSCVDAIPTGASRPGRPSIGVVGLQLVADRTVEGSLRARLIRRRQVGHPPGTGRPGSPPTGDPCCGPPASTADNVRPISSTRGRRRRQSRPVASASFSASTAASSSWSRRRVCPEQFLLRSSGARSVSRSHRRIQTGPQRRPGEGPMPGSLGGQDRPQLGAGDGPGVCLQGIGLGVPGRPPARLPDHPAGNQPDNQHDQQGPAKGLPAPRTRRQPACQQPTAWGSRLAPAPQPTSGFELTLASQCWFGSVASAPWPSRSATRSRSGAGRVPERSVEGRVADSSRRRPRDC